MAAEKRTKILAYLRKHRVIRPRDVTALGVAPIYLNKLYGEGYLERPSRGIYTLPAKQAHAHQTLLEACKRVPRGVVCLLTALQFHGVTTQLPFEIWLAIDVKARLPKGDLPPMRIHRFSKAALSYGIQRHKIANTAINVYSPAKTVADCFKYRNKIGLDVAIEALRAVWTKKKATMAEIHSAAEVCRVANVMQPYLEAIL